MNNLISISGAVQTKLHHFVQRYELKLKKPIVKFLKSFTIGSLSSKSIKINPLSKSLNEDITTKKTAERISYHLSKPTTFSDITEAHLSLCKTKLKDFKYIIFDDSDIAKPEATKMEGLAKVRDGSKSKERLCVSTGYKWSNVIAANAKDILPLYSEIFSTIIDKDYMQSENTKILNIIETVRKNTESNKIVVIDRGGDREVLMRNFLENNQHFIIRQTGKRHLWFNGKAMPLKKVYQEIQLTHKFIVQHKGKKKGVRKYVGGALQVQLPKKNFSQPYDAKIWLVATKEENKGFCWFLLYSDAKTPEEAVNEVFEGYKLRWRIEEFHRQIKQDFDLEEITCRKYSTIKSIGAMLTVLMSFVSIGCELPNICLLTATRQKLRKNEKMPSYIWYRMVDAICKLLNLVVRYRKKKVYVDKNQLLLFDKL